MSDLTGMFAVSLATDSRRSLSHCLALCSLTFDSLSVSGRSGMERRARLPLLKSGAAELSARLSGKGGSRNCDSGCSSQILQREK